MLWPLLLTLVGYGLAIGPVALGQPDLPEPLPLLVMAVALVWGFQVVARRRTEPRGWLRGLALCLQLLLLVGHLGWYFGLATYEAPDGVSVEGNRAHNVVATRVADGAPFDLLAQRGDDVVLVFFRGRW